MTATLYSDDALDEILRGDGRSGYIGLSSIDGLIAAVVAGPARIPTRQWLEPLFVGGVPEARPGSPERRVIDTIVNRHDTVTETLRRRPGDYRPLFMNHDGHVVAGDWCTGFMMGMTLAEQSVWMPWLLPPKRTMLEPILACTELGETLLMDLPPAAVAHIRAQAHHHIADAVVQLYRRIHHRLKPIPRAAKQRGRP